MVSKNCIGLVALSILSITTLNASNPLSPGAPVQILSPNTTDMPVVVSSNGTGFMTMAVAEIALQSSFSTNNGSTWNSISPINENAYLPMWVSGTSAGFMATWIGFDIGYTTASPIWSFSSDGGVTWSPAGSILDGSPSTTIYSPAVVSGTEAGFMVTWRDGADNNAYATFSSNNGAVWSTPINVSNSGTVNSAVLVAGTAAGFMATWTNTSNNGFASFTSNNGVSWTTPLEFITIGTVASDVWVSGSSSGFMATWSDSAGNAYSSFSSDNGVTWSSPLIFAANVLVSPQTDVSTAATTGGFVAAWIGNDNNAYGSFYNNVTSLWSTPVKITTDGSVSAGENTSYAENGYSFVGVNIQGDPGVMFAWLRNDGSTYSSFSPLQTTCLVPTITTATHVVRSGSINTINAVIMGGVPPYTVVWSDGFTQTVNSTSVSRTVKPYATTQYQIATATDSAACSGGPSNTITLTVIPCF